MKSTKLDEQRMQGYRQQGYDEMTAAKLTRADRLRDLAKDPDAREAMAQDRLAAQDAGWRRDAAEARQDAVGRGAERMKAAATRAAASMKQQRERSRDGGRGL